ncbi:MAG: polyphosphate polymerase domain-containing protein [Bermanella sp.]
MATSFTTAMALDPQHYEAAHMALSAVGSNTVEPSAAASTAGLMSLAAVSEANHKASSVMPIPHMSLNQALNTLQPHNLVKQNGAALMDRVDTKYLIPKKYLVSMLAQLATDYTVLCENHKRIFTYETTYFDTPQKHFYHAHHNGHLNRRKVRYRRYLESNIGFMEVKLKNNKRRTIKKRVPMDCVMPDQAHVSKFVGECLVGDGVMQGSHSAPVSLQTSLFVNYRRITLLNKHHQERLTIDVDLGFQCANSNNFKKLNDVFIVEVKRDAKQAPSCFSSLIKQLGINQINFSKYCMGLVLTSGSALKTNRFKHTLLTLKKTTAQNRMLPINNIKEIHNGTNPGQ